MPPTPKGRRTETAFLEAARRAFAEKGFLNTRVADIAAGAARSTASFYNYYESKEQLLEALLDQFADEVVEGSQPPTPHLDPEAGVTLAVTVYWTTYKKYLPEMIGQFQMSMLDDGFRRRWHETRAAGIEQILNGLRAAEREGYPIGLPLAPLASVLVSALEFTCWTWLATGGDINVETPDDETAIEILSAIWYRTVFGGDRSA